MKFLKSWLQDYIVETLPEDSIIVETLNKKAFEVEEVIATSLGTVFDIKVLPNRAHDALGHHGMAYELCASLNLTFNKEKDIKEDLSFLSNEVSNVSVSLEDSLSCSRFMSLRIDNVKVEDSPQWLKERLEAIGQRSINNIVDATNYVLFSLNKPMHAYDARIIEGALSARSSKEGETLITLDDKKLSLDNKTLVIADDKKVLGLAGIKGGKYSGIQNDTTSIILESANFNPVLIRKTSEKYGYKTDASKRFENGIANNLVIEGLHMTANLICEMCKGAKRGDVTDVYPNKDVFYYVGISKNELNEILGSSYDETLIEDTLKRLSFSYEVFSPYEYISKTYKTLIGAGYKNPSSMRLDAPAMFSCSSLVSYLYKGVWMPSLSIDKYAFCKKINKEELMFGDLIFANTGEGLVRYETVEFLRGKEVKDGIDHVAMYLGDSKVLHATKVQKMVVEESLDDFSKNRKIVGYGRVIDDLNEKRFVIRVPAVRLDLRIKEDLAEEMGRIIGYEKLPKVLPNLNKQGILNKRSFYENKIKEILFNYGFSEVITYTFGKVGEVSIVKGLAEDKEKLRSSLSFGLLDAMSRNLYNAPLLGQKTIKIFEFGNVFEINKEKRNFAIAVDDGMKKSSFTEEVEMILGEIKRNLSLSSVEYETKSIKPYIIEIDFDNLISSLPNIDNYEEHFSYSKNVTYKSVSSYPFITRDVAMWVSEGVTFEQINSLIKEINNSLVLRVDLFDSFSKEVEGKKKTSYAFRLVFQSYERTLTDEEVNNYMEKYYELFKNKGYEIR